MRYAQNTQVSTDRSRAEIESTLKRYGATAFMYGWQEQDAVIAFEISNRKMKFFLPMPARDDPEFTKTPKGRSRSNETAVFEAWEQGCRQRWRSLCLIIKAKLEAVASGIRGLEDEFMADIVMPDGQTVSEHIRHQIQSAYDSGKMPKQLVAWGGENSK